MLIIARYCNICSSTNNQTTRARVNQPRINYTRGKQGEPVLNQKKKSSKKGKKNNYCVTYRSYIVYKLTAFYNLFCLYYFIVVASAEFSTTTISPYAPANSESSTFRAVDRSNLLSLSRKAFLVPGVL